MTEETTNNSKNASKKHNIAYTIASLPGNRQLEVRESANAWWMDKHKLYELFWAFRIQCTIEEACKYAGITVKQYKYFVRLHPFVHEIRDAYEVDLVIQARMNVCNMIKDGNIRVSWKYLETHRREEWGKAPRRRESNYIGSNQRSVTAEDLEREAELAHEQTERNEREWRERQKEEVERISAENKKRQEMFKKRGGSL